MAKKRTLRNNIRTRAVRTTPRVRPSLRRSLPRTLSVTSLYTPDFTQVYKPPVKRFKKRVLPRAKYNSTIGKNVAVFNTQKLVKKVSVCVSRSVRKRVLNAIKIAGRKGLAGGKWSAQSHITCKR